MSKNTAPLTRRSKKAARKAISANTPLPLSACIPKTPDRPILTRGNLIIAFAAAFVSFLVYLKTLAPTITGGDSGELITAAYTLGIAHPPGYPAWCLLGKLFSSLPIGDVAYRLNLMSAFWASLAIGCLSLTVLELTGKKAAALSAALIVAFSRDYWDQSLTAEVYSLNIFFVSLSFLFFMSWRKSGKVDFLYAWALVSGLSLTHHNTILPVIFLCGLSLLAFSPRLSFDLKKLSVLTLLFALGLSLYVYLPIRSASNPPMDWGNPETLSATLDHILRKQYAFGFTERPRELVVFLKQAWVLLRLLHEQFTFVFLLASVFGGIKLYRNDKRMLALFVSIILVSSFGLAALINFEVEREAIETVRPFLLPAYFFVALLIGIGLSGIIDLLQSGRGQGFAPLINASLILLPAIPLSLNYTKVDKSEYLYADVYAHDLLATLDQNAILFSTSDHTAFPLIYLQAVEGERPDITVADKYGYIEKDLYNDIPEETRSKFRKIPDAGERRFIENWIIRNRKKPVFFTNKRDMRDLPEYLLVPWGLLYKVMRKFDAIEDPTKLWEKYGLNTLENSTSPRDYTADLILCDYHFALSRTYLWNGEFEKTFQEFDRTAYYGKDVKETYNNLGSLCAESALLPEAISYFTEALSLDPTYVMARRNLAKTLSQAGDVNRALDNYRKVLETFPDDYEATLETARLYNALDNNKESVHAYREVIRLAPGDFQPYRELGFIYLRSFGQPKEAMELFRASLKYNPNQPDLVDLTGEIAHGNAPN